MTQSSSSTIPSLLLEKALFNQNGIYCYHEDQGKWIPTLLKDQLDDILKLCGFFRAKGIKKGKTIAIMLPTSREWDIIEKALLFLGAIVVGLDLHATLQHKKHILSIANIQCLIQDENDDDFKIDQISLKEIKIALQTFSPSNPNIECANSDICTIIFTSGTTNKPKGIAYTHEQFLLAAASILEVFKGVGENDRMLCWLPLSNLFQRMLNVLALHTFTPIYFVGNPKEVMVKIKEINPTFFIGVPLFYERVRQGILHKISEKSDFLKSILEKTIEFAGKKDPAFIENILQFISKKVILRPLKKVMGKEMRFMISGSAPCPKSVLNFFWTIGIPLYEAYGLSENIVPMAIGSPSNYKFGSVGKILDVNTIKFFEENEIGVKGPGVFKGYLNAPDNVDFTKEGFYLTGDTGYVDEEGYLFLTGRKSDWVKSSTGNRISVVNIENALKELSFISQIAVIGSRKAPIAIVYLNYPVNDNEISSKFKEKLKEFHPNEQIGGVLILDRPFSIEEGEMTPNLKLKRNEIEKLYQKYLDDIEIKVHEGQFIICRK